MIVYNQYNHIAADRQNLQTLRGGGIIYENSSVEYDFKNKYAVNSTSDQYIEWNLLLG